MDIYSKPGTKIVFINKNGYDHERESANKILKVGQIYTVESIDVRSFVSYVKLEEVPGKGFNTVMFERIVQENGK
jgi:hypothetical protein